MKKKILLIVVVLLFLGGSAGAYYSLKDGSENKQPVTSSTTTPTNPQPNISPAEATEPGKPQKACDILSPEVAKKILGDSAKASDSNNEAPKDANHVIITTCTYNVADNTKAAVLLMRIAKDAEGSAHDKEQFGPNKPADAEVVSGYGDAAYWDPDFSELNILKGKNWYVITNGSTQPAERSLAEAKQLADLLLPKL